MTEESLDHSLDQMRMLIDGSNNPDDLRVMALSLLDLLVDVRAMIRGDLDPASIINK